VSPYKAEDCLPMSLKGNLITTIMWATKSKIKNAPNTGVQPTAYTRREQRYLAWLSHQLVGAPCL
jgi:hypothetical protein